MNDRCRAEVDIELAVMDVAMAQSRNRDPGPGWNDLRMHAASCARCRDLLVFFSAVHDVEVEAAGVGAEIPAPARVLRLVPYRAARKPDDGDAGPERPDFAIAAASEHPPSRVPVEKSMTLTAEDGGWLVRIVAHADGRGAIAHLIPRSVHPGDHAPRARLLYEGIEYPFDDEGKAYLPGFPGEDVALIVS